MGRDKQARLSEWLAIRAGPLADDLRVGSGCLDQADVPGPLSDLVRETPEAVWPQQEGLEIPLFALAEMEAEQLGYPGRDGVEHDDLAASGDIPLDALLLHLWHGEVIWEDGNIVAAQSIRLDREIADDRVAHPHGVERSPHCVHVGDGARPFALGRVHIGVVAEDDSDRGHVASAGTGG